MFRRMIFASGMLAVAAFAQGSITNERLIPFPQVLRDHLQLTDDQVAALTRMNTEYDALTLRKQLRMAAVSQEIAAETAKDPLDPMALGLRYAELEQIRRELKDALDRVREKARALLNPAQLARLKTLEDAAKLQPLIQAGICENLLDPAALQPQLTGVLTGDFSSVLLGSVIPARLQASSACFPRVMLGMP